jgi:hypothetical protein
MSLSTAEEPKAPDLSELRDAVKAASKRGENVDEIRRALDGLEKLLTRGWTTPKPGETLPAPVELTALREAVEAAAKKGENVEAISKELELIEKAMTGKSFVRPKPLPPPVDQPRPQPQDPFGFPQNVPNFPNFPQVFPPGGGIDPEVMQKMQELQRKALEMMLKNPNDADAKKLMQEAQELLLKALPNNGLNMGLGFPNVGRMQDRFRLGIRMERLAPITADQLGLDGRGVAIVNVVPGSAAEKAGFKVHDIVLEFAGKPVSDDPGDLSRLVNDAKAGEKIDAVVMRKGKKTEIKGIELPEAAQFNPQLDIQPFPFPGQAPDLKPRLPRPDIKPIRPNLPMPNTLPDLGPKPGVIPGGLGNLPLPARPNLQALPGFPNPFNAIPNGAGNVVEQNSLSITMTNGQFTLTALQDGVRYTITGTAGEKEPVVEKITVTVGDKTTTATKLDDVPKEYRPAVEKLLKNIR